MSGGMLMVWLLGLDRLDRRAGGDAAHHRHGDRAAAVVLGAGAHAAEIALDDARGEAARRPPMPWPTGSGSLITSMARARFGRRRMKPRSSRAVISRWMPDLERRSSASFISSKEGGTPDFLQPLVDEAQQLELLAGQHRVVSPGFPAATERCRKQIMNGHYMFDMCSATI